MRSALQRVLEILAKHHGTVRSMATLLAITGELHVEASDGLEAPAHGIRYRIGEGIIGKRRRNRQADRRPAREPRA